MNADLLHLLAAWAWRTSLEALPLALLAILFWRSRTLPASWRWWLPALFFLRLAMPQVPETGWHPWSLIAWTQPAAAASLSATAGEIAAAPAAAQPALQVLPILWALGCVGVLGWILISHWRLRRLVAQCAGPATPDLEQHALWAAARMALPACPPLRVMPGWSTMAVHGWLRPELLVPSDLADRFSVPQLRGMLLHEMAHIRRRDVLWTWLALGLCALHWFNPLAWLALRRFHADRELACDAAALRALDSSARQDYGEALLLCLKVPALHAAPALAPFFRRFPELKQRLQNIMKPTAPTLRSRLLTALLVPAFAAVTFTTARAQRDGEAPKPAAPETPAAERPQRDGEKPREGARDGDAPKAGPRDGDGARKPGARDGDAPKAGPREGDGARKGGPRDGDAPKARPREGDGARKGGPRDGDAPKAGPRDGDGARKAGPRDGDAPKAREGAREGDAARPAPREGERAKPEGEKPADR